MKKKKEKSNKKLTRKDFDRMWGDGGPYSQVHLSEEIRILDDYVSRTFLVVEAEINPFTFEYIKQHIDVFSDDKAVVQLMQYADNRGKFGYVVGVGEVEIIDDDAHKFARKQVDSTTEVLIRMHKFIMKEFGLNRGGEWGTVSDLERKEQELVWNDETGSVENVNLDNDIFENETMIGSSAGIVDNKIRMYVVLAFENGKVPDKKNIPKFISVIKNVSTKYDVEVEDVESFQEYVLLTVLIPFDVAPADFIEMIISKSNSNLKKSMFQKDYLVTNVKKPTKENIIEFLRSLPLDRDVKISL